MCILTEKGLAARKEEHSLKFAAICDLVDGSHTVRGWRTETASDRRLVTKILGPAQQAEAEGEEEEDPRWELIRQLVEYRKFKDAAGFLSLREMEQEGRFAHQPDAAELPEEEPLSLAQVSIFDLQGSAAPVDSAYMQRVAQP